MGYWVIRFLLFLVQLFVLTCVLLATILFAAGVFGVALVVRGARGGVQWWRHRHA